MGMSLTVGVAAQSQSDYRESFIPLSEAELIQQAHDNNSRAQHQLATRLAEGRGAIPQNISQSLNWYNRAAKNGLRPRFSSSSSSPTVDLLPSPPLRNHHFIPVSDPSSGPPPDAIISLSESEIISQQTVGFDATQSGGSNSLVLYSWDFGNGETAQGIAASTVYDSPGTYVASVVVMDSAGQFASDRVTVTVLAEQDDLPLLTRIPVSHFCFLLRLQTTME